MALGGEDSGHGLVFTGWTVSLCLSWGQIKSSFTSLPEDSQRRVFKLRKFPVVFFPHTQLYAHTYALVGCLLKFIPSQMEDLESPGSIL